MHPPPARNSKTVVVGVKGVQLKRFEQVVVKLLSQGIQPHYTQLPPAPAGYDSTAITAWPFDQLPAAARVYGTAVGQLADGPRAQRKEAQVRSMLRCILNLLPQPEQATPSHTCFTIVDFGGGSGHLAIPLALLLRQKQQSLLSFRIIVVDLSERSLALMHSKASQFSSSSIDPAAMEIPAATSKLPRPQQQQQAGNLSLNERLRACHGIPNLFSFHGSVEEFGQLTDTASAATDDTDTTNGISMRRGSYLDMCVALHLCGEATDVALRLARQRHAAVVVAPCCVGKLAVGNKNPYIYQATGRNGPTVTYPQSTAFCQIMGSSSSTTRQAAAATTTTGGGVETETGRSTISTDTATTTTTTNSTTHDDNNNNNHDDDNDWNMLARAADYSCMPESRTGRNAARRTAKALIETDRRLQLQQVAGYQTALVRMEPWECTPKNDILLAWQRENDNSSSPSKTRTINIHPSLLTLDTACEADIRQTKQHLLVATASSLSLEEAQHGGERDAVDWTWEEEGEIRRQLEEFLHNASNNDDHNSAVFVFPTRLGGRKRKLIHYVAAKMKLAHWTHGKKSAEKTVAVARRRHTAMH